VLSGCELKGYMASGLEPDGSFLLVLTDEAHPDDVYENLQVAI